MPELSYGYVFKPVELNKKRKIYVERRPLGKETVLKENEIEWFGRIFLARHEDGENGTATDVPKEVQRKIADLRRFERYPVGLADYY